MYNYLHIALRGEVQGATRTLYTYPAAGSGVDPRWASVTVEPAAAIKRFLNANDCYILQATPLGHYFSMITRPAMAPERGFMMISILVDSGCALTGRQIMAAFNNLRKALIDDETLTDEAVEFALGESLIPREPVKLEAWQYHAPDSDEKPSEAAYRTYISVQELESIFSFPCQPDYTKYRCIIVVAATASLRPGVKMPRLTAPIRKLYSVVCPEGVEASATQAYDGDRLEISYTKPGFNTHKETVVVGAPSAYTKYEGSTIAVRTSAQTGIRFERRIPVSVVSVKGKPLRGYTITLNGRSIPTMDPYIEFLEKDLEPGAEVDIQVRSNNYQPLKLKLGAEELLSTEELRLELHPVEQTVTLRLDFGEDRVFEQTFTIEKNTPEYNRLHSGNFHGFRAHRQVTSDNSEVYNVDVTGRPVAPNFDSSGADSEPQHEAPKFENVADEARLSQPKVDRSLPSDHRRRASETADADYQDPEDQADIENDLGDGGRRRRFPWLVISTVAVIAAVVGLCIWLNPMGIIPDSEATPEQAEALEAGNGEAAVAAPPVPLTAEEQADVDYLNSSPVWVVSKLTSPWGKSLIEAMTDGDIDAVASHPYFAVPGRCTNDKAELMVNLAWGAKNSFSDRSNRRILKSCVKEGSIDLKKLSDDLARRRPSDNPNTAPRPGHPAPASAPATPATTQNQ